MNEESRLALREIFLKDSYPRNVKEARCAICGASGIPLYFNYLRRSYSVSETMHKDFVPQSQSKWSESIGERITGIFPVCVKCVPPCKKCNLPTFSASAVEYGKLNGAETTVWVCQHIQWGLLFRALIKKLFKL